MTTPIFQFDDTNTYGHTFHPGDPWPNEEKKDVQFHAFSTQFPGTEPVYAFWNPNDKEHTFHLGEAWPNEEKGQDPLFYVFPCSDEKNDVTETVYSFWNDTDKKHTFHLGEPRHNEERHDAMFKAFRHEIKWQPHAMCDGSEAKSRAFWLVQNKGLSQTDAVAQVMSEFPSVFGLKASGKAGGDEASSKPGGGYGQATVDGASRKPSGGRAAVDGKYPHTLELVQDDKGKSRLKISVTPTNPADVTMVAVHYSVNGEAGKEDMNFDINHPWEGTNTYVHVTPAWGPVCEPGSKVIYWLAAMEKGLIVEMPERACPHKENRLTWTAQA
eukprot:TRINITY_DN21670_c0_g1_i1.p1 TRINITY_DN21670_c0_g1~~TRINITY_DN21670_c0_g1_i1.p1  ORF type:complete len:327 (-),score=75.84 TRINITY_DN21670_c0_g1_i1:56-1036(-)